MKMLKKVLFTLVILSMALSIVSCSGGAGSPFDEGSFSGGYGSSGSPDAGDSTEGGLTGTPDAGCDKGGSADGSMDAAPEVGGESADMPGDMEADVPDGGESSDDWAEAPDGGADTPDESEPSDDSKKEDTDTPDENTPVYLPSGMITAGAWNDNDNYQAWLDLFSQGQGKFFNYTNPDYSWGYNSLRRVKTTVKCGENAVVGATVVATDEQGNALFSAVTDAAGNAYLFTDRDNGTITVTVGEDSHFKEFSTDSREIVFDVASSSSALNVIEIMLVVDVTGSMGDEIDFLKAELADVINRIAENNSNTIIKLALLFYRDTDDRVPFDYYDFTDVTTSSGLATQQAALNKQSASGGGDYPEAVDEALTLAVGKQWSTGATTKIIFHVLDAPAHTGDKYAAKLVSATKTAAEKGIRICPIICSGAAESTEYTMREAAIYTGGTFIFVTDDSGIGGSHHDPGLPNVTVELLNSLMVRLVNGYHSGIFAEPIYWKQDPNLGTVN